MSSTDHDRANPAGVTILTTLEPRWSLMRS